MEPIFEKARLQLLVQGSQLADQADVTVLRQLYVQVGTDSAEGDQHRNGVHQLLVLGLPVDVLVDCRPQVLLELAQEQVAGWDVQPGHN